MNSPCHTLNLLYIIPLHSAYVFYHTTIWCLPVILVWWCVINYAFCLVPFMMLKVMTLFLLMLTTFVVVWWWWLWPWRRWRWWHYYILILFYLCLYYCPFAHALLLYHYSHFYYCVDDDSLPQLFYDVSHILHVFHCSSRDDGDIVCLVFIVCSLPSFLFHSLLLPVCPGVANVWWCVGDVVLWWWCVW